MCVRPRKGNRRETSPALGLRSPHSCSCKVAAALRFCPPPKIYSSEQRLFFFGDDEMSYPHPKKKKERKRRGGGWRRTCNPSASRNSSPSLSSPSTLFHSLPIPPPTHSPKSWTTAKETEKSSPAPILAGDQHLFCSRRTHRPPDVTGSPGQSARGRRRPQEGRGRWGGALLPGSLGLAGGGRGQSHINPGCPGSAARAGCAVQGREGSPRRKPGPAATTSRRSSPSS